MNIGFKRVPAIDKCFAILELFARLKKPLGVSEIAKKLNYNKSTVFNMVHTLNDLGVLEKGGENKFQFGMQIYTLGKAAGLSSELISTVHPYLEKINQETKLSAFLGIRSGMRAVIIDKADTAFDIKLYSEIGMRIPLLAGAAGKVLLAQLPAAEVDDILSKNELQKFTPNSCVHKKKYKEMVIKARTEGIAMDMEPIHRMDLTPKLEESGIEVLLKSKIERIEPDGVVISKPDKKEEKVHSDVVVLALGAASVKDLAKELEGKIEEISLVGDGNKARKIMDAVYEGFQAAIRL